MSDSSDDGEQRAPKRARSEDAADAAAADNDDIDASLRCAVCHDVLYRPRTLPCQHNFCGECVDEVVAQRPPESSKRVACPLCQAQHPLAAVQSAPVNTGLDDIIAASPSARGAHQRRAAERAQRQAEVRADTDRRIAAIEREMAFLCSNTHGRAISLAALHHRVDNLRLLQADGVVAAATTAISGLPFFALAVSQLCALRPVPAPYESSASWFGASVAHVCGAPLLQQQHGFYPTESFRAVATNCITAMAQSERIVAVAAAAGGGAAAADNNKLRLRENAYRTFECLVWFAAQRLSAAPHDQTRLADLQAIVTATAVHARPGDTLLIKHPPLTLGNARRHCSHCVANGAACTCLVGCARGVYAACKERGDESPL
jgi:hypothetical protein